MFDVKELKGKIDRMVERIKTDEDLKAQFKKDPIKAVESVLGVDLPDEAIKNIIAETRARLSGSGERVESAAGNVVNKAGDALGDAAEKVTGVVSDAADAIKKLF